MLRCIAVFILSLAVAGCVPSQTYFLPRDMRDSDAPKVVILPLFDSSNHTLTWNLSHELTKELRSRIIDDRIICILDDETTFNSVLKVRRVSPEDCLNEIGTQFCQAQFVVLLDLVQHDVAHHERLLMDPCEICDEMRLAATLMMKVQITVVDVREPSPLIVLQEYMNCNYRIPPRYEFCCYCHPYKCEEWYLDTPCDQAHKCLCKQIADRIEQVALALQNE